MPRRSHRHLVLTMLPDEWDRLVTQARAAERDPYQQARWLLLRGLDRAPIESAPAPDGPAQEVESAVA